MSRIWVCKSSYSDMINFDWRRLLRTKCYKFIRSIDMDKDLNRKARLTEVLDFNRVGSLFKDSVCIHRDAFTVGVFLTEMNDDKFDIDKIEFLFSTVWLVFRWCN